SRRWPQRRRRSRSSTAATSRPSGLSWRRVLPISASSRGPEMNVDELILVSVDDHVIEPKTMFDHHVPEKYRDRAPHVMTDDDGTEYWQFEEERAAYMGLNAVAGCPPEEYGLNPTRYDQMRPGCYDIHERVRDMSA